MLSVFLHGTGAPFLGFLAGVIGATIAWSIIRGIDRRRAATYRRRQARARWAHQQELKSRVRFTDPGDH
ncbi:hypothetical protein [Humibacter ginsengiterrae]